MSINEAITNYILTDKDIEYYFNQYCIKVYNKQYDYNLNNCTIFIKYLFDLHLYKSSISNTYILSFLVKNDSLINMFSLNLNTGKFKNKYGLIKYLEFNINGKGNII